MKTINIIFVILSLAFNIYPNDSTFVEGKDTIYVYPISSKYKECKKDADCALVETDCHDMECGSPICLKYRATYMYELIEFCKSIKGPHIEADCPKMLVKCKNNICTADTVNINDLDLNDAENWLHPT